MNPLATAAPQALRRQRRSWRGWTFVGPFMVVFSLVLIAPIVYAVYLTFFQNRMVGGTVFVGLGNYASVFTDPKFWDGLVRVTLFLIIQVPIMLFLALLIALAIDSARLYAGSFFRIVAFLPYAVPGVVAVLMWGFIFGDQIGLVGNLNDFLQWSIPNPLGPDLIMFSIGNIVTWQFVGYNMLIFYSALRVIPVELYEAAALDGAGAFRTVTGIKLPALGPALLIALIFSIIGSFQLFTEPNILASIAPQSITTYFTPNLYAFNLAFAGQQFNYSATVAVVMGVLTMLIAYLVQVRATRRAAR